MKNNLDRYDRDTPYWNEYYKSIASEELTPSKFAIDMAKHMEKGKHLLDLGCGNGRDSLFFLHKGMNVTGIDASDFSIKNLQKKYTDENLRFVCGDFVSCELLSQEKFDYCYARFVLHAISSKQQTALFRNVRDILAEDGTLFIEARTIHDDIYGKGVCVGKHEFLYEGHYRRFIDKDALLRSIRDKQDFQIIYVEEGRGFAPRGENDPILLRLVLKKSVGTG